MRFRSDVERQCFSSLFCFHLKVFNHRDQHTFAVKYKIQNNNNTKMATGIQKHNIYILYKLQKYENKKCFVSIPKCSITEGSAYIFCKIQNIYFTTSPLPYCSEYNVCKIRCLFCIIFFPIAFMIY